MRLRRRSRSEQLLDRLGDMPWWQGATALALSTVAALGAALYVRKRATA